MTDIVQPDTGHGNTVLLSMKVSCFNNNGMSMYSNN